MNNLHRELEALGIDAERVERILKPARQFHAPEAPKENQTPLWRFLSVKWGHEEDVCTFLKEFGIEAERLWRNVKSVEKRRRARDREVWTQEPMCGYCIAKYATAQQRQIIVDMIDARKNVYNILGNKDKDFSFDDSMLQQFTDYMNTEDFDRKVLHTFNIGDIVEIEQGPFAYNKAAVESEDDLLVKVLVEMLGAKVPVTLDKRQVRKVA